MKNRTMRRTMAVLFAIFLVLSMMPMGLLISKAADEDMLMIAGYDILTPVKAQMPFETGGILYVPVVLFTRQDVSVTITNSGVTLASLTRMVFFDLKQNLAFDENGNYYMAKALYRNGYWFVPAQFTAERLNLYYSRYDVEPVGFVRVSKKEFLLSDEVLLRTYAARAQRIWEEYNSTFATSKPLDSSSQPGSTVSTPSSGTPATTPPVSTPAPKKYRVFLLFEGLENAETILSRLQRENALATFVFNLEEIQENPGLIRQIAHAGHSFALSASNVKEATEASDALFDICKNHVAVVFPSQELLAEDRTEMEAAGFSIWETTLVLDGSTYNQDLSVLQSFLNRRMSGALIRIRPGDNIRTLLNSVFDLLRSEASEYFPILPIDAPVIP